MMHSPFFSENLETIHRILAEKRARGMPNGESIITTLNNYIFIEVTSEMILR
jgi:hypothetical protein